MDQFQASILNKINLEISIKDAKISISNDAFIIEQSENAYLSVYEVKLKVLGVDVIQLDGKNVIKVQDYFLFKLDFQNPIKTIAFKFNDGIAEELTLPIQFKSKDKVAWDEKTRLETWNTLQKIAEIKFSTGIDLVNIYFRPCSDQYDKTIIELYTGVGKWEDHPGAIGRGMVFVPKLLSAKVDKLMGKFTVESDMFFKSITGLAFGAYGFRLSQYSKSGSLLFTSDYQYFAIQKNKINH